MRVWRVDTPMLRPFEQSRYVRLIGFARKDQLTVDVQSCVGTTWCRFGVGDSVGMAIRLEERYKSIRAPHKFKGAVSGCVRECAEAQNKE
jgi:NAD(P)H-nitrite reductase large subunit